MQKDIIVAVFAPTAGGRNTGLVGTAYPVSDGLLLTARHVVKPKRPAPRAKIRICWYFGSEKGCRSEQWQEIGKDALLLPEDAELDAALIRTRRPEKLAGFRPGRLLERYPRENEHWSSYGFAKAEKRPNVRSPGHFGGKVREMAHAAPLFEILDDAHPIAADGWKGVSGMPICIGDDILGIAKHVPDSHDQYDNKKLHAVPAWRILRDAVMREALGIDREDRLRAAHRLLHDCLYRSDTATVALAEAFDVDPSTADDLASALLDRTPSLDRLFRECLALRRRFIAHGDPKAVRVVADLMLIVLPWLQDAATVSEVCRSKGDVGVCLLAMPTKLRTLAEIIMAAADRRAASLRQPPVRDAWPEPDQYELPEPLETGRDADGRQFGRDWRAHLIETFDRDLDRFSDAFCTYIKERFIQAELRSPEAGIAEEELIGAIQQILHERATAVDGRETYYYIVRVPANPAAAEAKERALAKLKSQFPDIAFLRLAGSDPLPTEYAKYGSLRDLLY